MANLLDNFTGSFALLSAHAADSGDGWASYTGVEHVLLSGTGSCYGEISNTRDLSAWVPASSDYDVTFSFVTKSAVTQALGVDGRMMTSGGNPVTTYHARYQVGTGIICYKFVANAFTQLGSTYSAVTPIDGDTITLRMSGTSISVLLNGVTVIGPVTDSSIAGPGAVGVWFDAATGSPTTGYHIDQLQAGPIITAATSYAITNPNSMTGPVSTASGLFSVQPNGFLQAGDNLVVTVTDDQSQSVAVLTFAPSGTSTPAAQTFTYTPGVVGSRTLTFTHTYSGSPSISDPATEIYTATGSVATFNPNDAAVFWSPGVARFDVSGNAFLTDNGTYFKTIFSGSSLAIDVDLTTYKTNGIAQSGWPAFVVLLNGIPSYTVNISDPGTGINTQRVTLASGLGAGPNYIQVWHWLLDETDTQTPKDQLEITDFVLAGSSDTLTLPDASSLYIAVRPKRAMVFGDSITMGSGASSVLNRYANVLLAGLDAEGGIVGKSGQGWLQTLQGWTGLFPASYNLYSGANARSWPALDYLVVNEGTNDASDITSAVASWLADVRSRIAPSCWIVFLVPFTKGTHKSELLAGVASYQSTHSTDTKIAVVDVTDSIPLAAGTSPDYNTIDGTHPTQLMHALYGAAAASQIKSATAPASGGGASFVEG